MGWSTTRKKGPEHYYFIYLINILTHGLGKTYSFQGDRLGGGGGDGLGVWDRNATKLGCDGRCTTINVIKSIKFKKKLWNTSHALGTEY